MMQMRFIFRLFTLSMAFQFLVITMISTARAESTCPVSDGVICGKSRQWLITIASSSLLLENKGTCHVWAENNDIYGCLSSETEFGKRNINYLSCDKEIKSSADCSDAVFKGLNDLGCEPTKVTCAMEVKPEMYNCSSQSSKCMDLIQTGPNEKHSCPPGYEIVDNDNIVKFFVTAQLLWLDPFDRKTLNSKLARHGVSICRAKTQSHYSPPASPEIGATVRAKN